MLETLAGGVHIVVVLGRAKAQVLGQVRLNPRTIIGRVHDAALRGVPQRLGLGPRLLALRGLLGHDSQSAAQRLGQCPFMLGQNAQRDGRV